MQERLVDKADVSYSISGEAQTRPNLKIFPHLT